MLENGYNIYGPIIPFSEKDAYPTHLAKYGKGGFISVDSNDSLLAIPTERLEEGMLAYVINDETNISFYQYLNNNWERAKLPNNISISTNIDTFKTSAAEGDITVFDNKFYYKTAGDVSVLPVFTIKDTEDSKSYNLVLSDENLNFAKDSKLTFANSSLTLSSDTNLKLGEKIITEKDTDTSISLPDKAGKLALTSDFEGKITPLSDKIDTLLKECFNYDDDKTKSYTTNYYHINPVKDENGVEIDYDDWYRESILNDPENSGHDRYYGRFLNIKAGDNLKTEEGKKKTVSLFLFISGKVQTNTGASNWTFNDIVGISFTNRDYNGWNVRHLTTNVSYAMSDGFLFYDSIRVLKNGKLSLDFSKAGSLLSIATCPSMSLDIKVIKNYDEGDLIVTWYESPKLEKDYTGGRIGYSEIPSFAETSYNFEITNTYNQQTASVSTIDLGSTSINSSNTKTFDLDVPRYNTFILDCEKTLHSYEENALIFNVTVPELEEDKTALFNNTVIRFVFTSTVKEENKAFDYFKLTYDGKTVLDLAGLGIEDGESIYVTPIESKTGETIYWSYFRESDFPKHDETLKVELDNNNELRLGVSESAVGSEKLYTVNYENLIDPNSGVDLLKYNSVDYTKINGENIEETSCFALLIPKNATILDIHLKDIAAYVVEKGYLSDTSTLTFIAFKRSDNSNSKFTEGRKLDVIFDFISPRKSDVEDFFNGIDKYIVNKVRLYSSPLTDNGEFVGNRAGYSSDGTFVNNSNFGFSNFWNATGEGENIECNGIEESYFVIDKSQTFNYRHHIQFLSLYNKPSDFNYAGESYIQNWGIIDTSTYFTPDNFYEEFETELNKL